MIEAFLLLLAASVSAKFVLPNCTTSCPARESPCWDILDMWKGNCSDVGNVYTQLHPATDCTGGCWKLVSVVFEGTNQRSQGNHNIFAKMKDQNGNYVNSYPNGPWWTGFWGSSWNKHDGEAPKLEVKGKTEWGDFPVYASSPDWEPSVCKCPGPYGAYAGNDMSKSDVLFGAGMPWHRHVNWVVVWQWMVNGLAPVKVLNHP